MRLAEIHERTHLPLARLRYVLDNEIVAGLDHVSEGRGKPRDFSPGQTGLIALAAALLENGLSAPFARGFIDRIIHDKSVGKFSTPPAEDEVEVIEIAGIFYGRVRTNRFPSSLFPHWRDTRTGALLDSTFNPLTFVAVDIAELRRRLFGV